MFGLANWQHVFPTRIVFGAGRVGEMAKFVEAERVLLVTSPGFTKRGATGRFVEALGARKVTVFDAVASNPDLDDLDRAIIDLRGTGAGEIVAVGGGSVLDTAKVLSAGLAEDGWSLRAHLASGAALPSAPLLPVVAVPTTAGTGSEVTPFATVWDTAARRKLSFHSPRLFPRTALLDPELTLTLPRETTIHCGLDALSQGLESVWNRNATAITLALAGQCVALALQALPLLAADLENVELRSRMLEASLLSGVAISQTRTALAHAMSYPFTAHFGVPHGLACGFTLPALLAFNAPQDDGRLLALARQLGFVGIGDFQEALGELLVRLEVAAMMRRYVPSRAGAISLIPEMFTVGRSDNSLRTATARDVEGILEASLP